MVTEYSIVFMKVSPCTARWKISSELSVCLQESVYMYCNPDGNSLSSGCCSTILNSKCLAQPGAYIHFAHTCTEVFALQGKNIKCNRYSVCTCMYLSHSPNVCHAQEE